MQNFILALIVINGDRSSVRPFMIYRREESNLTGSVASIFFSRTLGCLKAFVSITEVSHMVDASSIILPQIFTFE
jgi:hypothetical protein